MQTQIANLMERFQVIDRERMQGLPFYNQQLQVEALGFQELEESYVGALITPWFINLIWLYKHNPEIPGMVGRKCRHALPCGEQDFMIGEDEVLGRYDFISLASPVGQFKSRQQAQEFALNKLHAYFARPDEKQLEEHPLVFVDRTEHGISRRDFLSGGGKPANNNL